MTPPIQLQRLPRRKKPARQRASLFLGLLLAALLLLALTGCSQAGAQEQPTATAQELKRAAAGEWLCPGMHAEWISNTEVQCLKER